MDVSGKQHRSGVADTGLQDILSAHSAVSTGFTAWGGKTYDVYRWSGFGPRLERGINARSLK